MCAQYLDQRDAEQAAHAETRRERDEWQRQASLLASDRDDVLRSFKREQSEAAQAYRTIRDLYDVQAETIARLTDVFDVCREYFYCDPHTLSQAHHDRATAAINAYEATQPAEPPGDARLP